MSSRYVNCNVCVSGVAQELLWCSRILSRIHVMQEGTDLSKNIFVLYVGPHCLFNTYGIFLNPLKQAVEPNVLII